MKKTFFLLGAIVLMATSCTTVRKTATAEEVANTVASANKADLEVSTKRISYTFRPNKQERRGGQNNVKRCAVAAALEANGGSDVLVQPNYTTRSRCGKIKEVTVTGYPAKYTQFQKH